MAFDRVLAVAAASGRVGYVFLIEGKLYDWRLSRKASRRPEEAAKRAEIWIRRLQPEVVVMEKIDGASRKSERTRAIIAAIAEVAANEYVYDVAVSRPRSHANKYEEAAALAERFPELRPWVPRPRKLWESEPRDVTYFEALSLALTVLDRHEVGRELPDDAPQESLLAETG